MEQVVGTTSLRERKKARTRAALLEVSQRLFAEQGYAETTLEQICHEVELTPQTLLRYFSSKAHLAVAPLLDAVDALRAFLDNPGRTLPTIVVWQEYVTLEVQEAVEPSSAVLASQVHNLRAYRHWTERDPVLVAMVSDIDRQLRDVLAAALVVDWDAEPDDLHVALVASALVGGRLAVWNRWLAEDLASADLLAEHLALIAYVRKRLPRSSAAQLHPD